MATVQGGKGKKARKVMTGRNREESHFDYLNEERRIQT